MQPEPNDANTGAQFKLDTLNMLGYGYRLIQNECLLEQAVSFHRQSSARVKLCFCYATPASETGSSLQHAGVEA
jgi:hypothetical protein